MSPQLKAFLNRNLTIIDDEEFDKLICPELLENDLLDEFLDAFYEIGGALSSDAIIGQLVDRYIKQDSRLTKSQKEKIELKTRYLINKHLIALVKTIIAEQR